MPKNFQADEIIIFSLAFAEKRFLLLHKFRHSLCQNRLVVFVLFLLLILPKQAGY